MFLYVALGSVFFVQYYLLGVFSFFFPPGKIFINMIVLYLIAEPAQAKYNCFSFNQLLWKNMIVLYLTRLATPRAVGRRTSWGELRS